MDERFRELVRFLHSKYGEGELTDDQLTQIDDYYKGDYAKFVEVVYKEAGVKSDLQADLLSFEEQFGLKKKSEPQSPGKSPSQSGVSSYTSGIDLYFPNLESDNTQVVQQFVGEITTLPEGTIKPTTPLFNKVGDKELGPSLLSMEKESMEQKVRQGVKSKMEEVGIHLDNAKPEDWYDLEIEQTRKENERLRVMPTRKGEVMTQLEQNEQKIGLLNSLKLKVPTDIANDLSSDWGVKPGAVNDYLGALRAEDPEFYNHVFMGVKEGALNKSQVFNFVIDPSLQYAFSQTQRDLDILLERGWIESTEEGIEIPAENQLKSIFEEYNIAVAENDQAKASQLRQQFDELQKQSLPILEKIDEVFKRNNEVIQTYKDLASEYNIETEGKPWYQIRDEVKELAFDDPLKVASNKQLSPEEQNRLTEIDKEVKELYTGLSIGQGPGLSNATLSSIGTRKMDQIDALLNEARAIKGLPPMDVWESVPNWLMSSLNKSLTGVAYNIATGEEFAPVDKEYDPGYWEDIATSVFAMAIVDMPVNLLTGGIGGQIGKQSAKQALNVASRRIYNALVKAGVKKDIAGAMAYKAQQNIGMAASKAVRRQKNFIKYAQKAGASGMVIGVYDLAHEAQIQADYKRAGLIEEYSNRDLFKQFGRGFTLGASIGALSAGVGTINQAIDKAIVSKMKARSAKAGVEVAGFGAENTLFVMGGAALDGRDLRDVSRQEYIDGAAFLLGIKTPGAIKAGAKKLWSKSDNFKKELAGKEPFDVELTPLELKRINRGSLEEMIAKFEKDPMELQRFAEDPNIPAFTKEKVLMAAAGLESKRFNPVTDFEYVQEGDMHIVRAKDKEGMLIREDDYGSREAAMKVAEDGNLVGKVYDGILRFDRLAPKEKADVIQEFYGKSGGESLIEIAVRLQSERELEPKDRAKLSKLADFFKEAFSPEAEAERLKKNEGELSIRKDVKEAIDVEKEKGEVLKQAKIEASEVAKAEKIKEKEEAKQPKVEEKETVSEEKAEYGKGTKKVVESFKFTVDPVKEELKDPVKAAKISEGLVGDVDKVKKAENPVQALKDFVDRNAISLKNADISPAQLKQLAEAKTPGQARKAIKSLEASLTAHWKGKSATAKLFELQKDFKSLKEDIRSQEKDVKAQQARLNEFITENRKRLSEQNFPATLLKQINNAKNEKDVDAVIERIEGIIQEPSMIKLQEATRSLIRENKPLWGYLGQRSQTKILNDVNSIKDMKSFEKFEQDLYKELQSKELNDYLAKREKLMSEINALVDPKKHVEKQPSGREKAKILKTYDQENKVYSETVKKVRDAIQREDTDAIREEMEVNNREISRLMAESQFSFKDRNNPLSDATIQRAEKLSRENSILEFGLLKDIEDLSVLEKKVGTLKDFIKEGKIVTLEERLKMRDEIKRDQQEVIDIVSKGKGIKSSDKEERKNRQHFLAFPEDSSFPSLLDAADSRNRSKTPGIGPIYSGELNKKYFHKMIMPAEDRQEVLRYEYRLDVEKATQEFFGAKNATQIADKLDGYNKREKTNIPVIELDRNGQPREVMLELSQFTALQKWFELRNPNNWEALFSPVSVDKSIGNGFTEKTIRELDKFIKPEVKEFGEHLVKQVNGKWGKLLEETFIRESGGLPLEKQANYWPVSRTGSAGFSADAFFYTDFSKTVQNRNVIGRKKGPQRLDYVGAYEMFDKYVRDAIDYSAMSEPVRKLEYVFRDPLVRTALKQNMGNTWLKSMDYFIERFSGRFERDSFAMLDRVMNKLAKGILFVNVSPAIKQTLSSVYYLNDGRIAPEKLAIETKRMFEPNNVTSDLVRDLLRREGFGISRMDGMAARNLDVVSAGGTRTFGTSLSENVAYASRKLTRSVGIQRFNEKYGGYLLSKGDQMPIFQTGGAYLKLVYEHYAGKKLSNSVIQRAIDGDIEPNLRKALDDWGLMAQMTQQSIRPSNVSMLRGSSSYARSLSMFSSGAGQIQRVAFSGLRKMHQGYQTNNSSLMLDGMRQFAVSHVISGALFGLAGNGFKWDNEEMLYSAAMGNLRGLAVFGSLISFGYDKMRGRPWADNYDASPVIKIIGDVGESGFKLARELSLPKEFQDARVIDKYGPRFAKDASQFLGLNLKSGFKIYEGIEDARYGMTDDPVGRILGISNEFQEGTPIYKYIPGLREKDKEGKEKN